MPSPSYSDALRSDAKRHSRATATHPSVSRRGFHKLVTAGAAGLALPAATQAQPARQPGWIDAHVHVWTPDTDTYPLAAGFAKEDMQPASFTPDQLFAHCRPAGVDRVVLIQMSYYRFDNRYMLDMIAQYPETFVGVAIVDPQASDVGKRIRKLSQRGVRGLRLHPRPGEAEQWRRDPAMQRVWRTARECNIAICPLINPEDIPHVQTMCQRFPEVTVVVDHFARIGIGGVIDARALRSLVQLARFPNTYVKTSAFYALGHKQPPYTDLIPMIRQLVDAFGAKRLMWASDCPFQVDEPHTYEDSIALIRDRIDFLSTAEREAMLRDTAASVFFSPPA